MDLEKKTPETKEQAEKLEKIKEEKAKTLSLLENKKLQLEQQLDLQNQTLLQKQAELKKIEASIQEASKNAEACQKEINNHINDGICLVEKESKEITLSQCIYCLSFAPTVVFLPCRHMVTCGRCGMNEEIIEHCPCCKTKIKTRFPLIYNRKAPESPSSSSSSSSGISSLEVNPASSPIIIDLDEDE